MSSLPGYTLEAFLMWNYDLIVGDDDSANPSLQIAEAIGTAARRPCLTTEQFAPLVALYEPYRDDVERRLSQFDSDSMSWRDYAGSGFDFLPASLFVKGRALLLSHGQSDQEKT